MKKMIAICALVCAFSSVSANFGAKTNAFVQPFSKSYALGYGDYLWFTDEELTNPTGTYCDIFYEINRLSTYYPGYLFTHVPYGPLMPFEYGIGDPWLYAVIYSDLKR
ncbi:MULTISPECIES: hypothetical protein [Niastella]|uniref:Uncharacterized protein n=1 Tax=Niastella soli TaxID=2821487 RepID=A0ABS3Z535_9BACT|nr:hypothetical protein [Niastella soli]MBO9205153.1 hypothetical protein [Niastella soli]